jgi:hypothetical protein
MLEHTTKTHPDLKEMINVFRMSSSPTAHENLKILSPETTKIADLLAFVSNYGSIQLAFHRVDSSSRVNLTKKVLSNSLYMYNASLLLQRCSKPDLDQASVIKSLAKIIEVSRKVGLPHTQWTRYQDATLVFAVAKHGWLDQETAVKNTVNDSSISWGEPFEKKGEGANSVKVSLAKILLSSSGKNVALILSTHRTLIDGLKGFNRDRIVKTYGLVRPADDPERWVCRDIVVHNNEVSDLPPKKDLVRRAKAILSRTSDKSQLESHGMAALDPFIAAHAFLEEILRAVVRDGNLAASMAQELFDIALKEIQILDQACISQPSSPEIQELRAMYQKVTGQLAFAKRHISKSRTQAKNLVRVTLGEEPLKARRDGESSLPEISSSKKPATASTGKPASPQRISSKTMGDRAIEAARRQLFETFGASNPEPRSDLYLYLTEVETLIVTIATGYGLPVWIGGWKDLFKRNPSKLSSRIFSWWDFYLLLTELASKRVDDYKKRVNRFEKELRENSETVVKEDGDHRSAKLRYESASNEFSSSVSALEQIQEYENELDNLAKKTIMLLAKIHQMTALHLKASDTQIEGVGPDVIAWMRGEVRRWSESFELLADDGEPLAYTAVEFLNEVPEDERITIEIATVFDRKNCTLVSSQNASSTRIRSLLRTHPDIGTLRYHLDGAISTETWKKKPIDWTTLSDVTLLCRLSIFGYGPSLLSTELSHSSSSPVPAFSAMKLNRGHIQLRADLLVRELHAKCNILQPKKNDYVEVMDNSSKKRKPVDDENAYLQKKAYVAP